MSRHWMTACIALTWLATASVHADIFTWVGPDGITNVSNEPPPEGVRVTKVVRTAPKDPAREAAIRQAEVRALRDRVDELTKEVAQRDVPPPYAPAPLVAMAPPAPPAPTVVVTVINQPAQPEVAPASSGCDYTFGGCGFYFPGYTYYAPPFQRGFHKPNRGRPIPTPTRPGLGIPPPLIPYPTSFTPGARRLG